MHFGEIEIYILRIGCYNGIVNVKPKAGFFSPVGDGRIGLSLRPVEESNW